MFIDEKGIPDCEKILGTLDIKKRELASFAKVRETSVRSDRMSEDLRKRIEEWAAVLALVTQFFEGDLKKTELWFRLPNPSLGNIPPRDMIRFGRFNKLFKFIQEALRENQPA